MIPIFGRVCCLPMVLLLGFDIGHGEDESDKDLQRLSLSFKWGMKSRARKKYKRKEGGAAEEGGEGVGKKSCK